MNYSNEDLLAAKAQLKSRYLRKTNATVVGRVYELSVHAASFNVGNNVHAIGIGKKVVEGQAEPVAAIRIHVVQKLPHPWFLLPTDCRVRLMGFQPMWSNLPWLFSGFPLIPSSAADLHPILTPFSAFVPCGQASARVIFRSLPEPSPIFAVQSQPGTTPTRCTF
ncbi:MAG: hypothetical protein LH606_05305 [Cytophagaceae bacterium]|nr:hypothetical protein [Cytophagaceae bacterium]